MEKFGKVFNETRISENQIFSSENRLPNDDCSTIKLMVQIPAPGRAGCPWVDQTVWCPHKICYLGELNGFMRHVHAHLTHDCQYSIRCIYLWSIFSLRMYQQKLLWLYLHVVRWTFKAFLCFRIHIFSVTEFTSVNLITLIAIFLTWFMIHKQQANERN